MDIEKIKRAVLSGGGKWIGLQESVPPEGSVILFESEQGDSLSILYYEGTTQTEICRMIHNRIQECNPNYTPGGKMSKQAQEQATTALSLDRKLLSVYKKIDYIEKGGENEAQHYSYVRAADVVRQVRRALAEVGVYAEVNFSYISRYEISRASGKAPFSANDVQCTITFHDVDSNEIRIASGLGTGADMSDKAIYKAQTGALKYALRNAFLIPDEAGDPEADETVDERDEEPRRESRREREPESTPDSTPAADEPQQKEQEPEAPADDTSDGQLPTDEEMNGFRKDFTALDNHLSENGFKPGRGTNTGAKLRKFMEAKSGTNASKMSVQQWRGFFKAVEQAEKDENRGVKWLIEEIDKVNKK